MSRKKWFDIKQLEFIEFKLGWENEISRRDLMDFFSVSQPQASILLKRYQEAAPGNMEYDLSSKRYIRAQGFRPKFITFDAEEYLRHMVRVAGEPGLDSFADEAVPCELLPGLQRRIDPVIFQKTVEAIRKKHALSTVYQSMHSMTPTRRSISPHAFAFDGFRWHVRAYCHGTGTFRDFVLIRFVAIGGKEPIYQDPSLDALWHEYTDVKIGAHPDLSSYQRQIIERDFGMQHSMRVVRLRKALVFYFLHRQGLLETGSKLPQHQQIVLLNREELVSFVPQLQEFQAASKEESS